MAEKKELKTEKLKEIRVKADEKAAFLEFLKKKEAEKVPETILEMTPEEEKDFHVFIAERNRKQLEEGYSEMNLLRAHHVNNVKYGPGRARIPNGILGTIAYNEQKRNTQELQLNTSNKKMIEILQSGQSIPRTVK